MSEGRKREIHLTQQVAAAPEAVFSAFTHERSLREWLCQEAFVRPEVGGPLWLWWNDGFHVAGEITEVQQNARIRASRIVRGRDEVSSIEFVLAASDGGTRVEVHIEGPPIEGEEHRWADGLENLASVWGMTGNDLRVTRRPLIGVQVGSAVPAIAAGLPEGRTGIEVLAVLEDSAADRASLRKGDTLIDLGDQPVHDESSLAAAKRNRKAGETVAVTVVRDGAQVSSELTFGTPPAPPEIPERAEDLAALLESTYAAYETELDEILAGVSEEAASRRPSPEVWSVNEILAHILPMELGFQPWLAIFVAGGESRTYTGRLPMRRLATLRISSTLSELRAQLRWIRAGTAALVRELPEDFVATPTYIRAGQDLVRDQLHTRLHHDQLRRVVAQLRT